MARSHDLPPLFEKIHPRFNTPHYAIVITGAGMIAALLLADLALVVAVSTFAMLLYYLIANIAALRLPRENRKYPKGVPIIGALSCVGLIAFLSSASWIIGCIGVLIGGLWFLFRRKNAS